MLLPIFFVCIIILPRSMFLHVFLLSVNISILNAQHRGFNLETGSGNMLTASAFGNSIIGVGGEEGILFTTEITGLW